MTVEACAALVERGDPDRFRTALTAPAEGRGRLIALYAFNLEVARAPWVTQEPMIAEMRLQWWADTVAEIYEGKPARAHEVAAPLAAAITGAGLPRASFDALIAARRRDIYPDPPEDAAALWAYLSDTGGGLMALAAGALTAPDHTRDLAQKVGTVVAAATYLSALPTLTAAGRTPLPRDLTPADLAAEALATLRDLQPSRTKVARDHRAAFLPGWMADHTLGRIAAGKGPQSSEFRRRATLLWAAATGRW